jgi:hypothetical protein
MNTNKKANYTRRFHKALAFLISIFLLLTPFESIFAVELPVVKEKHFKVAIFKEEAFPALGSNNLMPPNWLYDFLVKDFSVIYLNSSQLSDKKCLNLDTVDLLILPYGEAFPFQAFPVIKEYLLAGGGLFNIAGRPFWVPMANINGKWERAYVSDPYKQFLALLGIKYYESLDDKNIGLTVTTTSCITPILPTHGNIFPYRIPCRDFFSWDMTHSKNTRSLVFVKSWDNPYVKGNPVPKKWCLIGVAENRHPLNPQQNPQAKELLADIMEYLSFPMVIYGLETNLAAYYEKEAVKVTLKVLNNGRAAETATVKFQFLNQKEELVYQRNKSIKLRSGQRITISEWWKPKDFGDTFYTVQAILEKDGRILDKEESGFVVINKVTLKKGPTIQIQDNKFFINNEKTPILGINYYESKDGELLWLKPSLSRIKKDFKHMKDLGINFVRIHYHHSKWFRDYFTEVLKRDLDPYLQVADVTPLPSGRSLRILDAVIQLAQEQGLVLCLDIFSLVPKEMGNPIGWLKLKERISDRPKIEMQRRFIRLLAQRYRDTPGITWDLWNEPQLEKSDYQALGAWAKEIIAVFRENGDKHLITIGDNSSLYLLDILDYASIHTHNPEDFDFLKNLSKPFIFQEIWNNAGYSLDEEIKQKEKLMHDFSSFLKTEADGFIPWQWTRQARLWDNASDDERWDDELGICVRDDGSLKPAGATYSSLIHMISKQ